MFVGNLNFTTTQADLETLFATVGGVTEVFLPLDRATGQPRGFAFVTFTDPSAIPEAISRFDGSELQGRLLKVNEARERENRPSGGSGLSFDAGPRFKQRKPKGSRRGIRGRKRGF
jgi:cold-inducible RNA-binding protein